MSMVSLELLDKIDLRLRAVFPEQKDIPFGGVNMILVGDMGQVC